MGLGAARVIYTIQDLSLYIDNLLRGYVIAVIEAERGPLWEPTPVASWDEFERLFGRTYLGSTDPLVLKTGLQQGAKFLVVRIVNCSDTSDPSSMSAVASSVTLEDRNDAAIAGSTRSNAGPFTLTAKRGGQVTGTEVEPYSFTEDVNDTISINIGGDGAQDLVLVGTMLTAQEVADQINAGTTDMTAEAYTGTDGFVRLRITADADDDNLVVTACLTDAYDVLGLAEATYAVEAGTDSLVVSIDGGADQTFTLTAGTDRTAYQIATELASAETPLSGATAYATGGKLTIVSDTTGAASSVQVQAGSTADTPLGFDNLEHAGSDAGEPVNTLTFSAKNPGVWGDSLKVHVYEADLNPGTAFDVRVSYSNQGGLNEYFADMSMDSSSDRYVVDYINERSNLVVVEDEDSQSTGYKNRPAEDSTGTALTGGSDGNALTDADYIGDENAQTGMYASEKTDLSIDIIIPGTSSNTVIAALAAYCEDRGDLVAYAQIPSGLTPTQAQNWRMGASPYSHEAFNSHRLALFYGRPLVYDSRYDTRRYIPCLGMLAACIAKTDTYYNYSFAPVGPRRGTVDFVEGLDFNVGDYRGFQDSFAEYQINSLIISRKQGIEGALFWEQYTTQRAASALRDLNVVRFLTMMKKVLLPALRMFIFEPNHPDTWRELHRVLEPQLQLWKAQNSIYDYYLQTDRDAWFDGGELVNAVLNTGLEIDQGIYHARVLVQPTRAIRYLQFEVGVMRTGEAFSTYSEMKTLPGWARR